MGGFLLVANRAAGSANEQAWEAVRAALGRAVEVVPTEALQGEEVRLFGEPIRYNADGEVGDPASNRSFRVVAGPWRLIAPAS